MTTLSDLRTRMYARFDEGQQNYVTVAEANSLLNEGAAHLHNWVVNAAEFYIWKELPLTLTAGQFDYPLPLDLQKMLKVFRVCGNYLEPIDRIMPEEYRGTGFSYSSGYMIVGGILRILPGAFSSSLILWYAPIYQNMVADTDTPDVSVCPGWEEFIINQAVIACRIKEESDTSQLERRQAAIMKMIEESMMNRDMGRHQHVVDVER